MPRFSTVRLLTRLGHSQPQIAERFGIPRSNVATICAADGITNFRDERAESIAPPRSDVDNAVSNAFRAVVGFDPFNDGVSGNGKPPSPKGEVYLQNIPFWNTIDRRSPT